MKCGVPENEIFMHTEKDEVWKYVIWKKLRAKDYVVHNTIYMECQIVGKSTETGNRLIVS